MRIGVISDTHASSFDDLPAAIREDMAGVDIIVHAGDFTDRSVFDGLKTLGEVKAVCGNMDSGDLKRLLPAKTSFLANGKNIGVTHGTGGYFGITKRVRGMFDDADVIIYGHSHHAEAKTVDGCLLFNPGTARNSYGILTIEDEIKAEIIQI
ncbi:MAG: metallophosphoesterase family protein [Chloroflexota bacterium]|nr:metallophosphoesterase family protein [Chloroflexota bacterium]